MRLSVAIAPAFLLYVLAFPAFAASRSEYDQCNQSKDPDASITACTRILQASNETAHNRAVAYNNRGVANSAKGDYDRAIADYNEAIRLDPKDAFPFNNRGNAYRDKGDNDPAIADYNEAIRLDPKFAQAYLNRGRTNLYAGALPKALADLNRASELDPKHAYTALWLDIVNKRSNLPSRLAQATTQIDMTKWPAPVIRLFLGQLTPEAVLAAADDPNPKTKNERVCGANFFGGIFVLQQGKKDDAARLLRLAAMECPKRFVEYHRAIDELNALGERP